MADNGTGPARTVRITVQRFHPGVDPAPYDVTYEVPLGKTASVSQYLQYINRYQDGSVAHYLSCRRGVCSGCLAKVNGKVVRSCLEPVTGDIRVEPARPDKVIRDVVIRL